MKSLVETLNNVKMDFDPIQEDLNKIDYLTEDQKKLWKNFGDTPLKLKGSAGLYAKGFINKNNRRYSKMKQWVDAVQEDVALGKFTGRLDHDDPGKARLMGTAVLYKKLDFNEETGEFSYEGYTLPNEYGKELKGYVVSGVYVGNSTNGKGDVSEVTLEDGRVIEDVIDFCLEGIDFVKKPSNEYGRVITYEHEEGGHNMTLKEFKEKHPDLVEELKKEFLEMKMSVEDIEKNYPELWAKIKKELCVNMTGSTDYSMMDSINEIKDILKKLSESKISDTEEEKTEDLKKQYEVVMEELRKYKEKEEAEKSEKEKLDAIEEAIKDSEYKEQLKKTLVECKNAEEVKSKAATAKSLIEEILALNIKKEIPAGKSISEDKEDIVESNEEEIKELKFDDNL